MKLFLSISLLLLQLHFVLAQEDFYSKQWNRVYKYELKSLPKSAGPVVETIYARAKKEQNIPQLTKALIYQSKFAMMLEESAELQIIVKFQKEIASSKVPLRNILESILAETYWDYFQQNRWKYNDRSKTEKKLDDDFRLWDRERILEEIRRHFQNSLRNESQLKTVSLASINEILVQAENSKLYRPTLYDFLTHRALGFYSRSEDFTFKAPEWLDLKDPRLVSDFERVRLDSRDSLFKEYQALALYSSLLAFHKTDKDPSAYIQSELERLNFVRERGRMENKEDLTKDVLIKLKSTYSNQPASALIDFQLASILYNEGKSYNPKDKPQPQFKKNEALAILEKAISDFPKSDGAEQCKILRDQILKPSLAIKSEAHVPVNQHSRLLVSYTNVDSLTFFIFAIKPGEDEDLYFGNDSARLATFASWQPELKWSVKLPSLNDRQEHSTEILLPALKNGRYLIVASATQKLRNSEKLFAHAAIQSTNLALIETTSQDTYRYQVIDRNTGAPMEGAKITFKARAGNNKENFLDENFISGKNGFFEFKTPRNSHFTFSATVSHLSDQALFGEFYIYNGYDRKDEKEEMTAKAFVFTDRSIYRPGQTVFFKGILIKTKKGKSSVVHGEYVEALLEDVNGEEVGKLRVKTNSFGSFSGEFKLPANGFTGEYTLSVEEDSEDESKFYENLEDFSESETTISVEEYKRPTFEVTFKPATGTFKLNDSIQVRGSAITFSGAKVSNAKVNYRVKRKVRYPSWYYWSYRYASSREQELDDDETETNADGEFFIKFKSTPDEVVSKDEQPVFEFEITADVTDVNGETRSGSTVVKVGYQSVLATIQSPIFFNRKIADNSFTIKTENLNSQSVSAKGVISIYKIKSPIVPQRRRPWSEPDIQQWSEEEFTKLFPHDPFVEESEDRKLKASKQIVLLPFNTATSGKIKFKIDKSWELGDYLMELTIPDEPGMTSTAKHKFELIEPGNTLVPDNKTLEAKTDKEVYRAGETAKVKIGSASEEMFVTVQIEKEEKVVQTFIKQLGGNYIEVPISIAESGNSELTVHYSSANYNSFFQGSRKINVTEDKGRMEIETISFKDKLLPGSEQTWTFEIKGTNPELKEAEALASMYDASLDQFKPHCWYFNPIEKPYRYNSTHISDHTSFGTKGFNIGNEVHRYYSNPKLYFDSFDDFGFSITNNQYVNRMYLSRFYTDSLAGNKSTVEQSNDKKLKKGFISGKVTSEDGSPISGVNIVIKGTVRGTISDLNGDYTMEVKNGEEVVFSFVGYTTAQVKVGRKNILNVTMGEDVKRLSEIVVTALGIVQERRALGYSVSTVTRQAEGEYEMVFSANRAEPASLLQGKISGVQITGMPGGDAKIVIRGASSIDRNSNPLYVIDGVIVESMTIDKNEIASIQVLKDEAAMALYGVKGVNGVIIISTVSGQKKMDEELAKVNARKNFNETAFFFPQLHTDESGRIQFTFTTPESLTRWKLQLLAYNRELESATKVLNAVTQKDFMITPNAPRFLRVGDEIQFSAKIINLVENEITGTAGLQLTNAVTGEPVDKFFENVVKNQPFRVSAKGNVQVVWKLKVPSGVDAVQYRVVAKAGDFSDGEQNVLPVLSNRILVTETLPMFIRAGETKTFSLDKLKNTNSSTLQHHQLALEVTTNPAWYAVQALPYLIEYPYECSEQTFARYYANALATHLVNGNPKIKEVFGKWSSSNALISNLEKNQELKSTILQETPWLRDTQSETEQKKRIALLFDLNAMKAQQSIAIDKLEKLQLADGGFTWFAGGRYSNRFITQHIASGFGHLRSLKVVNEKDAFMTSVSKAIKFLDSEIEKDYERILKQSEAIKSQSKSAQEGAKLAKEFLDRQQVSNVQIHYLYMRSFYAEAAPSEQTKSAIDYFRNQTAKYWINFNLYSKGMIALIQFRNQNTTLANDILKSLKENSIVSEEMGMYWKENMAGWYWNESPVETQSLLIEAFAEIESNEKSKNETIDDLRIWLLKNKQTSQWETTKATTEAIYALLLNGVDWISLNDKVEITVGSKKVSTSSQSPEVATGYFKTSWKNNSITPDMGKVKIAKKGDGIAWGGLYWQYFEDIDKITPAETPLKLSKKVFLVNHKDKEDVLTEVNSDTPIAVGSLLRIRIELKTDRDMEFLHMKDMRAAGLEPVDVLSEYKWQEGLGYYQAAKDASTNFFFDFVPKGVYVFEYDLRVSNQGDFSNGITTIQNMYAPEFSSHSEGKRLKFE